MTARYLFHHNFITNRYFYRVIKGETKIAGIAFSGAQNPFSKKMYAVIMLIKPAVLVFFIPFLDSLGLAVFYITFYQLFEVHIHYITYCFTEEEIVILVMLCQFFSQLFYFFRCG